MAGGVADRDQVRRVVRPCNRDDDDRVFIRERAGDDIAGVFYFPLS